MKYSFYLKNDLIATFDVNNQKIDNYQYVYEPEGFLQNVEFWKNLTGFLKFINQRINFKGWNQQYQFHSLAEYLEFIVLQNYFVKLEDQFWIKPTTDHITYRHVQLYQHNDDVYLNEQIFINLLLNRKTQLTATGKNVKYWNFHNHQYRLVKLMSLEQVLNEYYASLILKELNWKHVTYELIANTIANETLLVSSCKIFNDITKSYLPLSCFFADENTLSQEEKLTKLLELYPNILKVFVFDLVISNAHRSVQGLGFLASSEMDDYELAPLFNHDASFLLGKTLLQQKLLLNPNENKTTLVNNDFGFNQLEVLQAFIKQFNNVTLLNLIHQIDEASLNALTIALAFITNQKFDVAYYDTLVQYRKLIKQNIKELEAIITEINKMNQK